jgi:hypothetical protein
VKSSLGAAAQQEDDKKNRNRDTYPPWAMAPIVSATKPAATAIATFNSMDNFIISPFNYGGDIAAPAVYFFLF